MGRKRIEVAAGVILRGDGSFLLGRRAPGTFFPGYWEFPGGKVEPGETPAQALRRELGEELGIEVRQMYPWIMREHDYEHAHVRLHFFEVAEWSGAISDHVHSELAWVEAGKIDREPMLPANGPILKSLRLPRMMGITAAGGADGPSCFAAVDRALERGLRLIQVRQPGLDARARRAFAREVVRRAHTAGALVVINGDAELAAEVGADGLHLPARQLLALEERPAFEWVGASCHDRTELERVGALALDYALLGPVKPTASHPGQPALGWSSFTELVRELPVPVFALGGLGWSDMTQARAAGAHGIAAIRACWTTGGR